MEVLMSDGESQVTELGEMLRTGRVSARLTQSQIAHLIGAFQTSISAYERGIYSPNRDRLIRLIELLRLDIDADDWRPVGTKRRGRWRRAACSVNGCERPVDSLALCTRHYQSEREKRNRAAGRLCTIEGCGRGEFIHGLCHRCDQRRRKGSAPLNEVRAQRQARQAARRTARLNTPWKRKTLPADAHELRRRWWANEADVNQLAEEYDLSDLYVELVLRRLLLDDGSPLLPGERLVHNDERLSTTRSVGRR
jgi:transcriptional regulator with XRE-family HTH domain